MMYVNGKWTFCSLGQRTCPYFQANHLHMSKYSYQDKSKHIKVKKGTLLVDMHQTKRRLCLRSLLVHEILFLIKLTVVMMMMMMMMMIVIMIQ